MNLLRKEFAPISEAAWEEIHTLAKETLLANLSARKFCDVKGPYGINFTSVSLGRLDVPAGQKEGGVKYGIHQVLPLVEIRKSFTLDIWELDNIERGAKDIDFDALVTAARDMAAFEEDLVFNGFKEGKINGLNQIAGEDKISVNLDKDSVIDAVSDAQSRMKKNGINEGAHLVAGPGLWKFLAHVFPGGTLGDTVKRKIGGSIFYSEAVDGALMIADREGDVELIIGQDFAVGYHHHASEKVELFLTESLTFRVIAPEAIIGFTVKK
jgi:uncharacterized linocin/CFP29 family protein